MTPDTSPLEPDAGLGDWPAMEEFLHEIAALAESQRAPASFHAALAARAVEAFEAEGAIIWAVSPTGSLGRTHAVGAATSDPLRGELESAAHRARLAEILGTGNVATVELEADPQSRVALVGVVRVSDRGVALLEIVRPAASQVSRQAEYERLLGAACEVAAQFHGERRLEQLEQRDALWRRYDHFARASHGSLRLDQLTYCLANESRLLVECDRVAVAVVRRGRLRVRAVSGVDQLDRRSESVLRLEALVRAVVKSGEALWYPSAAEDVPPQLDLALADYLESTPAPGLAVLPLERDSSDEQSPGSAPCGALVLENFDLDDWALATRERAAAAAAHAAIALENGLEHESMPGLRVWRTLRAIGQRLGGRYLPRTIVAALAVVAAALALVMVPAELTVRCSGRLQPELRRGVYAARDGVVRTLHVGHGEQVAAGDVLLTLSSPPLEYEMTRVRGEIETAQARLASLRASRLADRRGDADTPADEARLAIEQRELEQRLVGLEAEMELLELQLAQLQVTSPIAGQVLTPWDDLRALAGRPLERGDTVLEIGDTRGDWVVELHVPDVDVRHVLEAQREQPDLGVSFMLATDPALEYRGRLASVSGSTDVDEQQQNFVAATVDVDRDELATVRAGAGVVARIECGERSLGYVWTHRFIETLTRLLFF